MSIFKEIPPTAGWPPHLKDFLASALFKGSLEEDFKSYLDLPYAKVTYSGTAALYIILESLKEVSPKKKVVIPSFVCPLVALAVKKAGLEAVACDTNKDDFNFDSEALRKTCSVDKDILAVIAVHLAGIPVDLDSIKEAIQGKGIFLIEDCAQSLGAEYRDKKTGAIGDFSFYSLCRGKGLTIYEGGVIAAKSIEHISLIERKINALVKNNFLSEALKIFELFGYHIFYRPALFWFVWRLPQIFWEARGQHLKANIEYFSEDFDTHRVSAFRKSMGHVGFGRLEKELSRQRQNASIYIDRLGTIPGLKIIREPVSCKASYPYLTLLFDDPAKRDRARRIFKNAGLGVSQIYELAITDYGYLKDIFKDSPAPNARNIAARHLTLTTSSFLTENDILRIVNNIKGL